MTTLKLEAHRRQAHTAAGELSYLDVGAGPVALFVHGVGTNALLWRRVIEQVANERRRCIAVDLPLHGHSPAAPGQDFSMPALAEAVEALCEQLGLTGIDLVANDTGGAIAQVFAAHHPERLASLCLTNCETHDNVPPPAFRSTVRAARIGALALAGPWVVKDPTRARKSVFRNGYEDHRQPPDEIVVAFLRPVLGTRARARQFQRWVTAQRAEDLLAVEPALAGSRCRRWWCGAPATCSSM